MWPTTVLVLFLALQSNYTELGLKALDEKRYQEAVDNFINAIAADPKDYSLYFNLALAYSLMGKMPMPSRNTRRPSTEARPLSGNLKSLDFLLREKQALGSCSVPHRRGVGKAH